MTEEHQPDQPEYVVPTFIARDDGSLAHPVLLAPREPPPATELELEVKPEAAAALEFIAKETASVVEALAEIVDAGAPAVVLPDAPIDDDVMHVSYPILQQSTDVYCERCNRSVEAFKADLTEAACHGEIAELPKNAAERAQNGERVVAFSAFTAPRFANGEPEEGQPE